MHEKDEDTMETAQPQSLPWHGESRENVGDGSRGDSEDESGSSRSSESTDSDSIVDGIDMMNNLAKDPRTSSRNSSEDDDDLEFKGDEAVDLKRLVAEAEQEESWTLTDIDRAERHCQQLRELHNQLDMIRGGRSTSQNVMTGAPLNHASFRGGAQNTFRCGRTSWR